MVRVTPYGRIEVASAKSDPDPRVCGHERRWRALSTPRRPGSSRRRSSSEHRGSQGGHQTKPPRKIIHPTECQRDAQYRSPLGVPKIPYPHRGLPWRNCAGASIRKRRGGDGRSDGLTKAW